MVCKLNRVLYGLKQASKVWYDIIREFLIRHGFKRVESDDAVYTNNGVIIAMYVDDLLFFGPDMAGIAKIQNKLKERFKMSDLGELSHYLDMKITITPEQVQLTQKTYMIKVLRQFDMLGCNPISTFMKAGVANSLISVETEANEATIKWYQQLIDSLMWPAVHTQSNLAYSVRVLSRYAHNSSETHCNLLKQVLRYVIGSLNIELTFRKSDNDDLIDYSDSDFAELKDKRHSIDEYVFMLAERVISHSFKQQSTIAFSSCEVEYMALSKVAKEAIWARRFLKELGYEDKSILIYEDNIEAIDLIINPLFHKRIKHIEVRWHWIRQMMARGQMMIEYLFSKEMIADDLTKPLTILAFTNLREMLNLNLINKTCGSGK